MKNNKLFLLHIMDSITNIEGFIKGIDKDAFLENKMVQSAVIRQIEIIGEAVNNISEDFKQTHPQIPWRQISDMRNKLIHEYFGVDNQVVWNTITIDIPELKKQLIALESL